VVYVQKEGLAMKKISLIWKGGLLCIGALLGSLFSPIAKKEDPQERLLRMEKLKGRIENNLAVIEQYMDLKHGEGFFRHAVMEPADRTEMINMLKTAEGAEEYVRTL